MTLTEQLKNVRLLPKKMLVVVRKRYDNLDVTKKNNLITFFNYSFNAVPVSVLFYFVLSLWYDLNWFVTYICTIIFLFYGEYYYKWLRCGYMS